MTILYTAMSHRVSAFERLICLQGLTCLLGLFVNLSAVRGQDLERPAAEFFAAHCTHCHDANHESGLDLTGLDDQWLEAPRDDRESFELRVRIHDRIAAGDMPPEGEADLPTVEKDRFLLMWSRQLQLVEREWIAREGRSTQRRMNRYEYENALRDLLGVPWIQIKDQLPEDGEKFRYNKVGDALDVSHIQLSRYMSTAQTAMREAMLAKLIHPPSTGRRYYARDEPSLTFNFWPRENSTLSDRHSFPVLDGKAQPDVRRGDAPRSDPDSRNREAVGRVSSIFSDAGGYSWGQFRAPVSGRYRLRFKGYSIWVSGGGIARWFYEGFGDEKAPLYHLPMWHRPNADEVWPGRRGEPIGVYAQSSGQSRPLGAFDFSTVPTIGALEATLVAGEVIQTDGDRLFRTRVNGTDEQYVNPLARPDGMPGYAVQWMEVEGPLYDQDHARGYELMFGDLPLEQRTDGSVTLVITSAAKRILDEQSGQSPADSPEQPTSGFRGRFAPQVADVHVEALSSDPSEDAARLLRQFMTRAYSRPLEEAHFELFLQLFRDEYAKDGQFTRAMMSVYTAVLASPGFLFIQEQPGPLDDYAMANRIAFFLWNSQPDEELRTLATTHRLGDDAVLRDQTERMLGDPKHERFVEALTDYWLDVRKIDDTSPSTTLYNDYELDGPLKTAAIDETRMFVTAMIEENLPARNFIDSDFTFLNERLAQHYGIENVQGANMRRVGLPADRVRGGLLTQASVLKVTANGTTTSPVLRGSWISERILGIRIPPPPPVPAVEPDIRGAVTIRQQLEQHRADPSCASCHSRMDPPGLALENFDVMGGWRERYRAVSEEVDAEPGVGMNGQRFAFHYALPVDPQGTMDDGREFSGIRDLKRLLLKDERQIARNFVEQLVVFATGAPVHFSDRAAVEEILDSTESSGFGVRSIIHEIVQSEMFRQK